MIKYLTFSFAISVISWIVGMVVNAGLIKTPFYKQYLTKLNFITDESLNRYIGIEASNGSLFIHCLNISIPSCPLKKR